MTDIMTIPVAKAKRTFFVYNSICILHQNINGLISKSDLLTVCLGDIEEIGKNIDTLCFTEHNMKPEDIDRLIIFHWQHTMQGII